MVADVTPKQIVKARGDANQKAIVRALRLVGATVEQLHTIGKGPDPDLQGV